MTDIGEEIREATARTDAFRHELAEYLAGELQTTLKITSIKQSSDDFVKVRFDLPYLTDTAEACLGKLDAEADVGGVVEIPLDALEGDG